MLFALTCKRSQKHIRKKEPEGSSLRPHGWDQPFHCRGLGSAPAPGTGSLQAAQHSQSNLKKELDFYYHYSKREKNLKYSFHSLSYFQTSAKTCHDKAVFITLC